MRITTKTMETERLILRKFRPEDAHDMFVNYASDPEVTKYLTWTAYTDERTAEERIRWMLDQYAKGEVGDWAIEVKEIGQVIGSIGIVSRNDRADSVHIGYCIGRRWWHRGITSEAFAAVIGYLFSECGVNRIETRHAPENPHSGAVMRKCGLRYEGTLRQSDRCNAGITDADWYAILKEDWQKGTRQEQLGMRLPMKTIMTDRLLLRPFVPEDTETMFQNWAGDSETTRYMGWPTHSDFSVTRQRLEYLQEQYAKEEGCDWAIVLRETGELIGSVGAFPVFEATGRVETGYIIDKRFWHRGITTEAHAAVIDYLFTETDVQRIEAWHDARNPNSGAVMRKCGMAQEGVLRQAGTTNAGVCDMVWYAILKEDYIKGKTQ